MPIKRFFKSKFISLNQVNNKKYKKKQNKFKAYLKANPRKKLLRKIFTRIKLNFLLKSKKKALNYYKKYSLLFFSTVIKNKLFKFRQKPYAYKDFNKKALHYLIALKSPSTIDTKITKIKLRKFRLNRFFRNILKAKSRKAVLFYTIKQKPYKTKYKKKLNALINTFQEVPNIYRYSKKSFIKAK
jgi:hypothetical protein